jgi:DNA gyrase subunit B
MAKQAKYNDQSISSLKGADRVRKKPAVIFGSDGLEGCEHSFFEILSNSIDEAREGYGNEINIKVTRDKVITVEDFGRGVPLDWNENEQKYNWELVYCELYAGGKYDNDSEDSSYEWSLGTNGLGACATQYSSEFMDVAAYTNGTKYSISFKASFKNDIPAVLQSKAGVKKKVIDSVSFIWDLIENHGFRFGKSQDIEAIKKTVPATYLSEFETGIA